MAVLVTPNVDGDPGTLDDPGGGWRPPGGGSYTPPAAGSTNVMTKRFVDINWVYTEPEPKGACTGFEVGIFAGTNIETGELADQIIFVPGADTRRCLTLLELRSKVDLRSAVRACYGDFRSAWVNSATTSTFSPNVEPSRNDSNGMLKFPDGTIMQWVITPLRTGEQSFTYPWPVPFPSKCLCVSVTTQMETVVNNCDAWYQLVSYNTTQVRVYRQATSTSGTHANHPLRAIIVGWGC